MSRSFLDAVVESTYTDIELTALYMYGGYRFAARGFTGDVATASSTKIHLVDAVHDLLQFTDRSFEIFGKYLELNTANMLVFTTQPNKAYCSSYAVDSHGTRYDIYLTTDGAFEHSIRSIREQLKCHKPRKEE